jgi:hypothetical protein
MGASEKGCRTFTASNVRVLAEVGAHQVRFIGSYPRMLFIAQEEV